MFLVRQAPVERYACFRSAFYVLLFLLPGTPSYRSSHLRTKTLPLQSWSWPGLGEEIRYLLVRCLSPAPRNVLQRSLLGFLVAIAHRINDATRESFLLPHTNAMAPFHSSLFQWVVAQHGHHTRMTTAL